MRLVVAQRGPCEHGGTGCRALEPAHELARSDAVITVRVPLPDVMRASEVDLNISATRVHLYAGTPQSTTTTNDDDDDDNVTASKTCYELDLALPSPVLDTEATAKWDKKAHVLTLTLPLAPDADPTMLS